MGCAPGGAGRPARGDGGGTNGAGVDGGERSNGSIDCGISNLTDCGGEEVGAQARLEEREDAIDDDAIDDPTAPRARRAGRCIVPTSCAGEERAERLDRINQTLASVNLQRQLRRREAELDELWRENAARTKKAMEELVLEGSEREQEARVGRGAPGQAGRHPRGRDGGHGKSGPRVVGGR